MIIARRVVISGRVQGVGFRETLVHVAREAGLVGWVRNRRDGTVEAWLQGVPAAVERAIEWCRRGPPAARVDDASTHTVEADGALLEFKRVTTL